MTDDPYETEGAEVDVLCDCGQDHKGIVVGESAQLLEWWCPVENELKRDVNA